MIVATFNGRYISPIDLSYEYPIKTGTPEWKESNYRELVDLLQIPEEILYNLTTEALIETVLDYPFIVNLFLFNSYEDGFKATLSDFNGLRELVRRDDAASKLLQKRLEMSDIQEAENSFEMKIIDIFLYQESIHNQLTHAERTDLDAIAALYNRDVE